MKSRLKAIKASDVAGVGLREALHSVDIEENTTDQNTVFLFWSHIMKFITRAVSVLALNVVVAAPIALVGPTAAEAFETKAQEPAVTLVKFKKGRSFKRHHKHHGFKRHHGFKKHLGFKKHHGFKKHYGFKKF